MVCENRWGKLLTENNNIRLEINIALQALLEKCFVPVPVTSIILLFMRSKHEVST